MRIEAAERRWRGWPGAKAGGYARAFGAAAADLDVDFARLPRHELVSALLARCLRPERGEWSGDEAWGWTLAQRLQGLLAVARASGVETIAVLARCAACDEPLEIDIEAARFERDERITSFEWSPQPGRRLSVRLPTGEAQRAWWRAGQVSPALMAHELVRDADGRAFAPDAELPAEWIDGVAGALAEHDPLTALDLSTGCPACGAPTVIELDLEAQCLHRLQACQEQTLREIHWLARSYHWSEAAILELPPWRRRYYLAQLGMEAEA